MNSYRKLKVRHPHPTHTPRKRQLMLQITPVERRVENILPWGEVTSLLDAHPRLSRSGCLGLSRLPSCLLDTQIPLFTPNLQTHKGPPPTNDPSSCMPPLKTPKARAAKAEIDQQDCAGFCAPKATASRM